MIQVILFLLFATLLAFVVQRASVYLTYNENPLYCGLKFGSGAANLGYTALLLLGIFYAGLRGVGNDTTVYIINYLTQIMPFPDELTHMDWSLGANPGFHIYQSIIKLIFGNNALWFTMITAIISTISLFEFYRRYSSNFTFSIYLLISSTLFVFTMAAMKQTLAFSIGIWILPLTLKQKWRIICVLLFIACSIHPYVIFFMAIPFLVGEAFSWKIKGCVLLAVLIGSHLTTFMDTALTLTESIGDEYKLEYWEEGTGVKILRLPFFLVTPIFGLLFKKEVKKLGNIFLQSSINLSAISGCFMILALFGGANMFGRMANYWEPFTYVALPGICKCLEHRSWYKMMVISLFICFFIFYLFYYRKFGYSLFIDYYQHASVFDLF